MIFFNFIANLLLRNIFVIPKSEICFSNEYRDPVTNAEYESDKMTELITVPIGTTKFVVPSSVINIRNQAYSSGTFYQCRQTLTDITFQDPSNLLTIGDFAFQFCDSINHIIIPKSVTTIGNSAFERCLNLIVNFEEGSKLDFIDYRGFRNLVKMASIVLPSRLTKLGGACLEGCLSLTSVTIPSSIALIDRYAFKSCSQLQNIVFPDTCPLPSLPFECFALCRELKTIHLSNNVQTFGDNVFAECNKLERITVSNNHVYLKSDENGVLYNKTQETLIFFPPANEATSFTIPTKVNTIKGAAFNNNFNLKTIQITANVRYIDGGAFLSSNLQKIIVDPANKYFFSKDGILYQNRTDGLIDLVYFPSDNGIINFTIAKNVFKTLKYCFYDHKTITNVNFEVGAVFRVVGAYTFANSRAFTQFQFPPELTTIEENGFQNSNIESPKFNSKLATISSTCFFNCQNIVNVVLPDSIVTLGAVLFQQCKNLTKIVFQKGIKTIPESLCNGCEKLVECELPSSVTAIGNSAFAFCSLPTLVFPPNLEIIGVSSFEGNKMMREINLPNSVTNISSRAFAQCTLITIFNVPQKANSIENNAFDLCKSLKIVNIPSEVERISNTAFYYCESLERFFVSAENKHFSSVDGVLYNLDKTILRAYPCGNKSLIFTTPETVGELYLVSFYGAKNLNYINITNTAMKINTNTFYENTGLKCGGIIFNNISTNIYSQLKATTLANYAIWPCPPTAVFTIQKNSILPKFRMNFFFYNLFTLIE